MIRFLLLIGAMLVVALLSFLGYRSAPRGWTRNLLGLAWISALAFPICAILHNATEALFRVEEPVFFLLAVIGAPLGVVVGLVGAAVSSLLIRRRPA